MITFSEVQKILDSGYASEKQNGVDAKAHISF